MKSFRINNEIGVIGVRNTFDDYKSLFPDIDSFIFMNQVHGNKIIDVRDSNSLDSFLSNKNDSDGLLINKCTNRNTVFFIKTADCVPLVLKSNDNYFLIHAGWRSISLGIHKNFTNFIKKEDVCSVKVFFGPHAINNYEIKNDVISKIDNIKLNNIDDKFYFNMQETIIDDLIRIGVKDINIQRSKICTMTDENFYSHRCDNSEKMRNLMYVLIK